MTASALTLCTSSIGAATQHHLLHGRMRVDGITLFYRKAGSPQIYLLDTAHE